MPSPVVPSDFCELAPDPTTPPCDALKRIFFDYPDLLCTFFSWMFNANGTLSDDFKREVNAVPAGMQMYFGGLVAPSGFLVCNGGAYKQADYPYLYGAIGVRYGTGNGIDEFQVPDLGGRVVVGVGSGYQVAEAGGSEDVTLTEENMPSHAHTIGLEGTGLVGDATDGQLDIPDGGTIDWRTHTTSRYGTTLESGDGIAHNNMMPFLVLTPCIKT